MEEVDAIPWDALGEQRLHGLDRVGDRVANPAGTVAPGMGIAQVSDDLNAVVYQPNLDGPGDLGSGLDGDLLGTIGVHLGEQGIVVTSQGRGRCAEAVAPGIDQLLPCFLRERGGEQDGVGANGRLELEQAADQLEHVGVVGVHLIDDEDLAGESEQAQGLVLARQNGEQRLVDRADPEVREQGTLAVIVHPTGA